MNASRKLYDAVRSGAMSFDQFRDLFVDDGLAEALFRVRSLVVAVALWDAKVRLRSQTEIYEANANCYHFDIWLMSGNYLVKATNVSVLKTV